MTFEQYYGDEPPKTSPAARKRWTDRKVAWIKARTDLLEECAEKDQRIVYIEKQNAELQSMLTHAGILKAQDTHNQMISDRDAKIADLEHELAAWQSAAGAK